MSYLVMFAYVSLMLGDYHSPARVLVRELMLSHSFTIHLHEHWCVNLCCLIHLPFTCTSSGA